MNEATPFLKATGLGMRGRLEDLDLEIPRSCTLAILGPSGSGKTTLLRLLAGFEPAARGCLEIEGVLAAHHGQVLVPAERRGLSFAFQEPALMPHLDVAANVQLGSRDAAVSRRNATRQVLEDVGLAGFEARRIWQLSGGEAQRVQLARVLAARARMTLLDEPFASVDRMCRADLISRIGQRLRGGAGAGIVAIVTHDPADATELADLTVVMRAGRIVARGRFNEIAAGAFGTWPAEFLSSGLAGREIA